MEKIMYNEIINMREYYLVKQSDITRERMQSIVVNMTEEGKFLCICQVTAPKEGYAVVYENIELVDDYKAMRIWMENAQWYTNGNEYIQ